jgi:hypothetical protein
MNSDQPVLVYRASLLPLVAAGAAAVASLAYPLVGGAFAVALTLATIPVLATVAAGGLLVSWLIVRRGVLRKRSVRNARWYAGLVLSMVALAIAGAWWLFVFLTVRTADGSPHWALLAPVGLGLGVAVLVYWVAVAVTTRTAIRYALTMRVRSTTPDR